MLTPVPTPDQQMQANFQMILGGPRQMVEIGLPDAFVASLAQQNLPVNAPHIGMCLIDTGASNTCIDRGVAVTLGLPIINRMQVQTPAGSVNQDVFATRLTFPGALLPPLTFLAACGAELMNQGICALIGRDFLANKILIYDGILNKYSISW